MLKHRTNAYIGTAIIAVVFNKKKYVVENRAYLETFMALSYYAFQQTCLDQILLYCISVAKANEKVAVIFINPRVLVPLQSAAHCFGIHMSYFLFEKIWSLMS